jgi:hypothetical protein
MKRWVYYAAGVYLAPSRVATALVAGLAFVDLAYATQTSLLHVGPWIALGTASFVFKAVGTVSYLLG